MDRDGLFEVLGCLISEVLMAFFISPSLLVLDCAVSIIWVRMAGTLVCRRLSEIAGNTRRMTIEISWPELFFYR